MKIAHLFEERVDDYVRRLTRTLKIKKLGEGYYSSVFQHPVYHNVVVKLCRKQDPKTIFYLRECAKNPDNPWFPKIVGIHKVTFHDEDVDDDFMKMDQHGDSQNYLTHIIFMQKLRPCSDSQYRKAAKTIFDSLSDSAFADDIPPKQRGEGVVAFNNRLKARRLDALKLHKFLFSRESGKTETLEGLSVSDWKKIAKHTNDQHIRELAELLIKVVADDIHEGNVMIRDGHPVITDPVAS